MAKFLQAPVEQAEVAVAPVPLWQDPVAHQALAVMVLSALAMAFLVMLLRGLMMKSGRTSKTSAALSGEGYAGMGLKSASERPETASIRRS